MSIDYRAVLADLEARRAKLDSAIEAIRDILAESQPRSVIVHGATATAPASAKPGKVATKRTGTVASMAYEIIRTHGGPMKVADVVQSLRALGKFTNPDARSNYGTVFGTLNDDHDRFVKVGEGMFDIKDRGGASPRFSFVAGGEIPPPPRPELGCYHCCHGRP